MRLKDKVAIVTGSSRGIGRAIALTLARRGAHVVINYIRDKPSADVDAESVVKEVRSLGRRSLAVVDDVSDYDQMEDLVRRTVEEFGRIDILVNNAGTVKDRTIKKMTKDEWEKVISVPHTCPYGRRPGRPYAWASHCRRHHCCRDAATRFGAVGYCARLSQGDSPGAARSWASARVREHYFQSPAYRSLTVASSAPTTPSDPGDPLAAGAAAVVSKPLQLDDLFWHLDRALAE